MRLRDAAVLVATLFTPAPRVDGLAPPVIVVLNGSGGGLNEPRAALYASHGYAALALGYFKAPGLPDYISNTPLEYFENALQWVHRHLQPHRGQVALSGQSRGGSGEVRSTVWVIALGASPPKCPGSASPFSSTTLPLTVISF